MSELATFHTSSRSAREAKMYRQMEKAMDDEQSYVAPEGDSQITAQTRNPVFTPQCLVNLAATVAKGECKRRADEVRHNPSDVLAPPASSDAVHRVFKGFPVMHRAHDGAGFQTHMAADAGLEAVTTLNGLSKRVRLFMPGVAQVNSFPDSLDDGQAQTTVTTHGVQTIHNFGIGRVQSGDKILFSRFPPLAVLDESGGKYGPTYGPMVKGPEGCDPSAVYLGIMVLRGGDLNGHIRMAEESMRQIMGTKEFAAKANAIKDLAGLQHLFHDTADAMFNSEMIVDPEDPIRGYMLIWSAIRWYNILILEKATFTGANWGKHVRLAMMLRHRVMCEVEAKYATEGDEYACSLPHDGDLQDAKNSLQRGKSSLAGPYLRGLLGDEVNGTIQATDADKMREGETRLRMHESEMLRQFVFRIQAYINQYFAGTALSSADGGMSFDIMMGK